MGKGRMGRERIRRRTAIQSLRELIQKTDQHLQEKDMTVSSSHSNFPPIPDRSVAQVCSHHATHFLVELTASSGRTCSLQQNITSELRMQSQKKSLAIRAAVTVISPSRYKSLNTAVSRGQHTSVCHLIWDKGTVRRVSKSIKYHLLC